MKKIYTCGALLITALTVIFPHICQQYASEGVKMCINVLVPSLFPFIVCTNFLSSSGGTKALSNLLKGVAWHLFRISGTGSVVMLMGFISGYPVGAMLSGSMYKDKLISKNEAVRLLMFANNCGPLFVISAIGIGVFSSVQTGILLYASHILSALTVGFFARYFYDKNGISSKVTHFSHKPFSSVVPDSVFAVLSLCGYVVFFSSVMGILYHTGVCGVIASFLCRLGISQSDSILFSKGIFEMSSALFSSEGASLPAVSAVISFGGISVLFQTLSLCRKYSLPIKSYIVGKILSGGLSALYTSLLCKIFMPHTDAFSSASEFSYKILPLFPSLSVICLAFLLIYLILKLKSLRLD